MKKLMSALTTLLLALGLFAIAPATQADAAPPSVPGGRANYVATLMVARYNDAFGRLSMLTFAPNNQVVEDYWVWRQTEAPTTMTFANQVDTGLDTGSPGPACSVMTARKFTDAPARRTSRWVYDRYGNVVITHQPGSITETYRVIQRAGITELSLIRHSYANASQVFGQAFGSRASFGTKQAMNASALAAAVRSTPFTSREQNWNTPTVTTSSSFNWYQYVSCGSNCARGPGSTTPLSQVTPQTYHTYFMNGGGRKVYWYHQIESVAAGWDANRQTWAFPRKPGEPFCARPARGGHLTPMLQIIDDSGKFRGLVGVEASLYLRSRGSSIISQVVAFR